MHIGIIKKCQLLNICQIHNVLMIAYLGSSHILMLKITSDHDPFCIDGISTSSLIKSKFGQFKANSADLGELPII